MAYVLLILGAVSAGLMFYVKYLLVDRAVVKNNLDLYKDLHKIELDRAVAIEKIIIEEEKKIRLDYEKNPDTVVAVNRLLKKFNSTKTGSL